MTARRPVTDLRFLPIAVGMIGSSLLMVNRLLTPELTPSQSRSDVVGVLLSALLILTGLLWQQFQPKPPEAVVLEGEAGFELDSELSDTAKQELAWASDLLLTQTPTRSLVVWYGQRVILRRGILGPQADWVPGAIGQRVLQTQRPVYLVDAKLYPGRVEFNVLPPNTQGIICQPLGTAGVLILGANAPRSYTKQEEAWISAIAAKLDQTLTLNPSPKGGEGL